MAGSTGSPTSKLAEGPALAGHHGCVPNAGALHHPHDQETTYFGARTPMSYAHES